MGLPKVTKHKARKDLYKVGLKTPAENKQGYTVDRKQPSIEVKDEVIVKAGEEYYAWKRKGQPYSYSTTYPTFPVLISEWDEKFGDFGERINECTENEESEDEKQQLLEEIEEYRDELQSRLDRIPYQLQESSVLNERIEMLDDYILQLS
jgi:hypothetical protein